MAVEQNGKPRYMPQNKSKYKGKALPVIRSGWERSVCKWLDLNPSVIFWASESIAVPYYDVVSKKRRSYFPDFWALMKVKSGSSINYLIEVKPKKDTKPGIKKRGKKTKTVLHEHVTYLRNASKFKAAELFCKKKGWVFKVLTENEIFGG